MALPKSNSPHTKYCQSLCWVSVGVFVLLLAGLNIRCSIFTSQQDANACGRVIPEETPVHVMMTHILPTVASSSSQKRSLHKRGETNATIIQRFLQELEEHNLPRSARHQQKFHSKKHLIDERFPTSMLFSTDMESFGAISVNDTYGYIHIWKCGGTTIEIQSNLPQTHVQDMTSRYHFTFVRDPIDHFLSGWAECGHRSVKKDKNHAKRGRKRTDYDLWDEDRMVLNWMDRLFNDTSDSGISSGGGGRVLARKKVKQHMDDMVSEWLNFTLASVETQKGCARHSFPQTNFLLRHGTIPSQMVLVADLTDLTAVWKNVLERPFRKTLNAGRNSSGAFFKTTYFPATKLDWLSNATIHRLCEFVAIDYFLLDYEPPVQCDFLKTTTTITTTNR